MDLSLIRQINSSTSKEQYERTLAIIGKPREGVTLNTTNPLEGFIRKIVLAEDETLENSEDKAVKTDINPKVDFSQDDVMILRAEIDRLTNLVSFYQGKIDENLPTLKTEIDLSIFDYSSAYEATVFYSKDWFANSLMSDDAKIDFATYLLSAVSTYCSVNLDSLTMISSGDANILMYIEYPRNTNS